MPQLLADVPLADASVATERIKWLECFTDNERVTDFNDSTDPAGNFESNSSSGHKEYQDRLRSIALHAEGKDKGEIAAVLGRSTKFVQTWWKKHANEVPRPPGVHEYLKAEFWRDIEIVRGFGKGLGIYDEVVPKTEWTQAMADGSAFKGGYRLKYDKEGRMRPQGNQHAKDGLVPGRYPSLDKLTQRLCSEKEIDDRVLKRPGILWYPDGDASAIEHRHEAWTALFSFGAPRILTIDKQPVLLRDGDLIIFGTQRHGVPKMCDLDGGAFNAYGGRISVVYFFMPTGQQSSGAEPWKAITDSPEHPSRKAVAMLKDADLGLGAQMSGLKSGAWAKEMAALEGLGFPPVDAAQALKSVNGDVEKAAELLLMAGSSASSACLSGAMSLPGTGGRTLISELYARLEDMHKKKSEASSSSHSLASRPAEGLAVVDGDEALALLLQNEEECGTAVGSGCCPGSGGSDWEEFAILEQIQELERQEEADGSTEALRSQFDAYEEMLDAKDAEEWDGRGDLMVREWRRSQLHIEQQDAATIYALGCGALREKDFFELLSLNSIRVLYDLRGRPDKDGLFSETTLEIACKSRSIHYRHIALGRETAYGILKHLTEDEGRNSLAELVWHARRKRTAFLGQEEDWRLDDRVAIASSLVRAGHSVQHIDLSGALEAQPKDMEMPDHIMSREARLRMLEKQRLAGDLNRPIKSAVSRSTEYVAQRLSQPQEEIDAGAEIRKANTQAELCRAQRRLADLQRRQEDSFDVKAGLGKKVVNVNKWVKAEAMQQREHLAAGKTKDGKEKGKLPASSAPIYSWTGTGGTAGGNPDFQSVLSPPPAETAMSSTEEVLLVECLGCSMQSPWTHLQEQDGRCHACFAQGQPDVYPDDAQPNHTTTASGSADFGPSCPSPNHAAELNPASRPDGIEGSGKSNWRSSRRKAREGS